jgi:hypothetical protein
MNAKTYASVILLFVFAAGCSYPTTSVKTLDTRARIGIVNASPTAALLVNGVLIGQAAAYNSETAALAVSPGSNLIEVKDGERVVYSQKLFLGEGTSKTITLPN